MAQDPFDAAWEAQEDPFEAAWGASVATEDPPQPSYTIPMAAATPLAHSTSADTLDAPAGPPAFDEAVRSVGRGAAQAGIGVTQSALLAREAFDRATEVMWEKLLGYDVEGVHGAREAADKLQTVKENALPARGERGFATHTAPEALGSAMAFMLGGAATGGATVGIAGLGAASGFADGFYDAVANGATEEEAWTSAAANGGLGLTEAVPLGKFLARFNRGTGGSLRQALLRMFTEGTEEVVQEVVQGGGSNIVAKGLYDEERELLQGLKEGGAAGFFVGALLSVASSGAARARGQMKANESALATEQEGTGTPKPMGAEAEPTAGPLPTQTVEGAAESGQPVTVVVPEGNLDGLPPGEVQAVVSSVDGNQTTVRDPEAGQERVVPTEWVQPASESEPTQPLVSPEASEGNLASEPATMPTEPGLFGEVEAPSAAPQAAVGQAAAPTPSMFDEQPGDLPGQKSLLDLPGAAPEKPKLTRSEAAQQRQAKMKAGETTLRDFIAAHGGLAYTPELWARFSRKETGERGPVGVGLVVHPKGSGRGMSLHDAITLAGESGMLFNPEGSYGVGHDEFLDALESDVTPLNAERIQREMEEQARKEAEQWDGVEPPSTPEAANAEADRTVSVMNRKMDEDMAALGMEPGKRAEPTTEKAWDDEAASILADDPFAGQKLLDDLRAKPRAPSGTETAILTREMVRMSLERDRLNQEIIDAYEAGNVDRAEALEERAGKLVEASGSAADVLAYAGSESGRSLRARQMTMALDYSLLAMERAKLAANKGEMSDKQREEIRELSKRINDLQQALMKAEAASDERVKLLEEQIDTLIKGKSKERRRARRQDGPVITYISNQAAAARERIKARGTQLSAGFDPLQWADHIIVGVEYIAKDVRDFTAWSKSMLGEFGDAVKPHLQAIFDAAKAKVGTMTAEAQAEAIKAKSEGGVRNAAMQIRKLAESFIESGVTERDALIDAVHEVLVEVDPAITRRDTMDLISGYGDFKPLSKDAVKVRLRELRGEMQQLAKLEDMLQKGELPLRSGVEHAKLSDEARRLQQQVNETKRRLNLQPIGDPETHLRSALDAIRTRLEHQIADLQHQVDSGQQILKERTKPKTDAEIEALRKQRDALKEEFDAIFNPPVQAPGSKEVARAKAAEKATEKAIKEYERRIREGEVKAKARTPGFSTPALDALRARRDALAEELANLRMAQMTDAEKDARSLKAFKTRAANELARLREKIAAEDFAPKPKRRPLALDSDATALRAQLEQVQQEYRQGLEADRRRNMTKGQKAWMYGKEVFNIRRALFASFDLSALLRQGKWIVWSHPIESARAAKVMLRSLASEDYYQKVMVAVREQAHSGLYVAEVDSKLSAREEEIRSNLADKIPGMRASNRAFTALLNVMRVKIHAQMTASVNAPPGSAAAKYFAEYVNIATGRGEPGRFAPAANAAAYVLWSPRLYLSRIQTLTGWALWRPDRNVTARERRVVAKEYGRAVAGMIAYYTALQIFAQSVLADDDDEAEIGTNPLSSDFGKVRIGEVRIDPMAGMAQFAVLGARLAAGKTVTTKGEERDLTNYGDEPPGYGQANIEVTAGRFLRTKLNPTIGMALDLRQGTNAIGEPIPSPTADSLDFAIWLMAPLSLQGAIEGVQELGWSRGVALGVFEALGDGVQIHAEKKPKAKKAEPALSIPSIGGF